MKLKLTTLYLLLFIFPNLSIGQQTQTIDSSYVKYFENTRELPHLHLNKTIFLKGEEIWFQAYVLEQNSKKPHPTTSNLYISIFESNGNLKDQQLVRIRNGIGYGSIYIDSTFTKDHYYLKASTKWMKNFNEDNAFSEKISILSDIKKKKTQMTTEKDFFDFQVFPESGYLIEDMENNMGILIKDKNSVGQKIVKGVLKEVSGEVVNEFDTNIMGLGSLDFFYEEGKQYFVEAFLENGSTIIKKVPLAKKKGIALHIDNPNTQYMKVRLLTNATTLDDIEGTPYKVWIHNTNTYYKNTISFQKNETAKILFIKNDKLAKGMNIVTVFDKDNTPILERLVFNYHPDLFVKPKASSMTVKKDSLMATLTNTSDKTIYLSASFLPESTKAYNPTNTIYTSFLLKPYLKGDIQNPNYYFKEINRKKLKDLDLLLLTQGWSKYQWDNIFNNPPTTNFDFENGIDLSIRLNKPIKKKQSVFVYSKDNNLLREIKPGENPYVLKNAFFKKSSEISFALKSRDNLFKTTPVLSYSNNTLTDTFSKKDSANQEKTELEISNFKTLSKGTELLDEVVVKSKKKKYENDVWGRVSMFRRVDAKKLIVPSNSLAEYVRLEKLNYSNLTRKLNTIFLNNNDISGELWLLKDFTMDQVREVAYGVNLDGVRELHIFTHSINEFYRNNAKYTIVKLPVGFAKEKEYYEPKYPSLLNNTYKYYGAIFWKPNITITPNSSIDIRISKHLQKNINVYIEGITEDGKLIYQKRTLQ